MAQTTTPGLTVKNGNWGGTSLRTIAAVLTSAADVLLHAFGRSPDAPIHVAWWSQDPRVFDARRPYQIRLNARDTYWSQYVYQFCHELCHVMINFDRYPGHKHRWFDESLCELASLFVLHRLAASWAAEPPPNVTGAAAFAPHHRAYAEYLADKYPRPRQHDIPRWLTDNVATLQSNRSARTLTGTVAVIPAGQVSRRSLPVAGVRLPERLGPPRRSDVPDYLHSWDAHLRESGPSSRLPSDIADLFKLNPQWRQRRQRGQTDN